MLMTKYRPCRGSQCRMTRRSCYGIAPNRTTATISLTEAHKLFSSSCVLKRIVFARSPMVISCVALALALASSAVNAFQPQPVSMGVRSTLRRLLGRSKSGVAAIPSSAEHASDCYLPTDWTALNLLSKVWYSRYAFGSAPSSSY